jgi:hypothetical protein
LRARDWHGLQKDKLEFGKYLWCIVLLPSHLNSCKVSYWVLLDKKNPIF